MHFCLQDVAWRRAGMTFDLIDIGGRAGQFQTSWIWEILGYAFDPEM